MSAGRKPVSALSSVDLPAPDGPTTARNDRCSSANEMSSSRAAPPGACTLSDAARNETSPWSTYCSSSAPTSWKTWWPTETTSRSSSAARSTRRPLTKVPFALPRSATSKPPPGSGRSSAWRRETSRSSSAISLSPARPIRTFAPMRSSSVTPLKTPLTLAGRGSSSGSGTCVGSPSLFTGGPRARHRQA